MVLELFKTSKRSIEPESPVKIFIFSRGAMKYVSLFKIHLEMANNPRRPKIFGNMFELVRLTTRIVWNLDKNYTKVEQIRLLSVPPKLKMSLELCFEDFDLFALPWENSIDLFCGGGVCDTDAALQISDQLFAEDQDQVPQHFPAPSWESHSAISCVPDATQANTEMNYYNVHIGDCLPLACEELITSEVHAEQICVPSHPFQTVPYCSQPQLEVMQSQHHITPNNVLAQTFTPIQVPSFPNHSVVSMLCSKVPSHSLRTSAFAPFNGGSNCRLQQKFSTQLPQLPQQAEPMFMVQPPQPLLQQSAQYQLMQLYNSMICPPVKTTPLAMNVPGTQPQMDFTPVRSEQQLSPPTTPINAAALSHLSDSQYHSTKCNNKRSKRTFLESHQQSMVPSTPSSVGTPPSFSSGSDADRDNNIVERSAKRVHLYNGDSIVIPKCRGRNAKKGTRCCNVALMEFIGPQPQYCSEHIQLDPNACYHKCRMVTDGTHRVSPTTQSRFV
jgi:hypothetical protein